MLSSNPPRNSRGSTWKSSRPSPLLITVSQRLAALDISSLPASLIGLCAMPAASQVFRQPKECVARTSLTHRLRKPLDLKTTHGVDIAWNGYLPGHETDAPHLRQGRASSPVTLTRGLPALALIKGSLYRIAPTTC